MAIYLHERYAPQIQGFFSQKSLVAGRLNAEYSMKGAKTVKIMTPVTVPLGDYDRSATSNRYGAPLEMQDIEQELTMTQDRSFAMTIDKGNDMEQDGLKAAGRMLKLQIAERCVPEMDGYIFKRLAYLAGTVAGSATALSSENVVGRIAAGAELLDNAEVPAEGRTLFLPGSAFTLLKSASEFMAVDKLAEKALSEGVIGMFEGMDVVKVPASRWPANVNFLIVYKNSATAPVKLNETRLHQDPPGLSGALLEGRFNYDCFVFGPKCKGVYADIDTSSGKASQAATPTRSSTTLSCATSGMTIRYSTDGSDPRYSAHTKDSLTITAPASLPSGARYTVRAYAYDPSGAVFPSAVYEAELTV